MMPQIIMICLTMIGLGLSISNHGKTESKKENAYIYIISLFITYVILYYGGFFDVFFK